MNTAIDIREPDRRDVSADAPAMNYSPIASTLERVVMDPSLPVERVEHILALFYQAEDRARQQAKEDRAEEARTAYFAAMSACQKELPVVVKNQRNKHTNSDYADLAAIEKQAMPKIHEHGFGVTFQPCGYNELGELQIKWQISHSGGHVESDVAGIPVDSAGSQGKVNKTGTQAFGSTATYGRRYLLCMLFNISTGDDHDGNRVDAPPEKVNDAQVKRLRDLLAETDSDVEKFCDLGRIEALPDMLERDFDAAIRLLEQKKAKMGAAK